MPKPKSGIARYLSELRYRLIWAKESRHSSAAARSALAHPNNPTLEDVKTFLRTLTPRHCGKDLVRIGPDEDGGYLLPDDLDGIDALFSPGVSETLGFDLEIAQRGIQCFLADASVTKPDGLLSNMNFMQKFIGPENRGDFVTMQKWIGENTADDTDLLLQMDIEGAEYDVLPGIAAETLARFRIMLIEFHDFDQIFNADTFNRLQSLFARLSETHVLCHLHANNTVGYTSLGGLTIPPVFEATYIRRDRVRGDLPHAQIPHPLDQHNSNKRPNVQTPHFWAH